MNREDFPMLNSEISYFDNGATTLKPSCVVQSMIDYYTKHTSNIHRGDYDASVITNRLYDDTRDVVREFINCNSSKEVIFTSGSTASINMVVFGYMKNHLKKGDEVLNITNDFVSIKRKKGEVDIIPIIKDGESWRVDFENIVTIGYGDNTVTFENENGVQITNF